MYFQYQQINLWLNVLFMHNSVKALFSMLHGCFSISRMCWSLTTWQGCAYLHLFPLVFWTPPNVIALLLFCLSRLCLSLTAGRVLLIGIPYRIYPPFHVTLQTITGWFVTQCWEGTVQSTPCTVALITTSAFWVPSFINVMFHFGTYQFLPCMDDTQMC